MPHVIDLDTRLRSVFAAVFGVPAATLRETDSPMTIAEWDSLSHVSLILSLEGEFGVEFDAEEIPDLNSVAVIRQRLSGALDGHHV